MNLDLDALIASLNQNPNATGHWVAADQLYALIKQVQDSEASFARERSVSANLLAEKHSALEKFANLAQGYALHITRLERVKEAADVVRHLRRGFSQENPEQRIAWLELDDAIAAVDKKKVPLDVPEAPREGGGSSRS